MTIVKMFKTGLVTKSSDQIECGTVDGVDRVMLAIEPDRVISVFDVHEKMELFYEVAHYSVFTVDRDGKKCVKIFIRGH